LANVAAWLVGDGMSKNINPYNIMEKSKIATKGVLTLLWLAVLLGESPVLAMS
jgi:hypothetical protein